MEEGQWGRNGGGGTGGTCPETPFMGKEVALLTDARFSGVSTGACIGHISPEALAGGPIGKVKDGDLIEIKIDTHNLCGSINLVGTDENKLSPDKIQQTLKSRKINPKLTADVRLHHDTQLWAALQNISGGTWGGAVYDSQKIIDVIKAGENALKEKYEIESVELADKLRILSNRKMNSYIIITFSLLLGIPLLAELNSWPQWRGPARDGQGIQTIDLIEDFEANQPQKLWESMEIPSQDDGGFGSVISDGKKLTFPWYGTGMNQLIRELSIPLCCENWVCEM